MKFKKKKKVSIIQIKTDLVTMFSYRHSLKGREAAAHLQGWTSEHYTSSAQLYAEMYTEVIS